MSEHFEIYKKNDEYLKVDEAGVVRGKVNPSELPKDQEIKEIKMEDEQEIPPTEEGAIFMREGKTFIVKNGTAVRATKEEIEEYIKRQQKENK